MLVGFESQSLAWLRESSRRKAELVWNSTTICWQSCSSSRGKIPQQLLGSFLSSPALTFPGSCQNSLLELMVLLHISHFTAAGAEQQELQKLQSLKRAADSLGVLLGMIIPYGNQPWSQILCPHNEGINRGTAGPSVWVTEEPEQQIQPQHFPWSGNFLLLPMHAAFDIPLSIKKKINIFIN